MDVRVQLPLFPTAPREYHQSHMNDLVGALNRLTRLIISPGEGRQTTIVLTNLQNNDYGLEPGTTFQVDGVLRVAMPDRPYLAGVSCSCEVGAVAVTV